MAGVVPRWPSAILVGGCARGQRRALRRRCRDADDPVTANELAWSAAIVPDISKEHSVHVAAAERAVVTTPKSAYYRNTLGAVLYRAGEHERAVKELEESMKLQGGGGTGFDWLFLAMAHRRLGHVEMAQTFLEKAREWAAKVAQQGLEKPLTPTWSDSIEMRALLGEAEALAAAE